ncbi:DUF4301 family protein [Maridesulfovibrio salexigens]|uniref:Putative cytoplasmic protein n=1 Tax=Maridesulfovibrio salexigens (strain ATCC 14822 / DSM 2638 / NCIMB 8403 / VKM B-1763) TaxID=526222 RepID=C6C054_MARSD|nr:DUF4301 family protein [Maridesulfovibrio salexigens]ACS80925.1 putative cytoplasmic protein [Maridesulfovibrio salexigens DSM 2638]
MKSSNSKEELERLLKEAEKVIQQIIDSGVAEETIVDQIKRFRAGFPSTPLLRPCTPGDGIKIIDDSERPHLSAHFKKAAQEGRVTKFVPASGAATRMFKSLLAVYNSAEIENLEGNNDNLIFCRTFIENLQKFAFYDELKKIMEDNGIDLRNSCRNMDFKTILHYVLSPEGLNFGNLPKGLIPFHSYPEHSRTPFAEHIVESMEYAKDGKNKVRAHFTVSPEHRKRIMEHVSQTVERYPETEFHISYSEQRKQTNTIAVDLSGEGFRTSDDRLLFRPAGHGALLVNLNELGGDIVFLKNIDNVAPDHLKKDTLEYKQILGGLLIQLQEEIFAHIRKIKQRTDKLDQTEKFITDRLSISLPDDYSKMREGEKSTWLLSKLNRPIRVCGMVENTGEPGGGPFWVIGPDGIPTPQIVEKNQVDLSKPDQADCMSKATHFNPVDIICGLRDYEGKPFNLLERIDRDTGFISVKSKDGKELKAMELPGLWNGAMADWITIFVEVPLSTFSPVKTVNDLLKPEHQPAS